MPFIRIVASIACLFVLSTAKASMREGALALAMPSIKKIEGLAQSTPGCISLAQGALRLQGVDQHIKDFAREILLTDKADYYQDPLGLPALRQRLAELLSQRYATHLSSQQIFIGHGGIGILTSLALTFLKDGDEVLLAEPTYPVYVNLARIAGASPVFTPAYELTPTKEDHHHSWTFNFDKLEAAITEKTRMIILSNPSNPLGICLTKPDLEKLVRLCESRKIYLLLDEVYSDFIYEGEFQSAVPYAATSKFIVQIGSFSKNFAMSGFRVGYGVAHPDIINSVAAIQASIIANPTVVSQYAALFALDHYEYVEQYAQILKNNRDLFSAFFTELAKHNLVLYGRPSAGFYFFFKVPNREANEFVMEVLQEAKVAMAPGTDFGPSATQCVRLCFARDPEIVAQSIQRLKNYFVAHHPGLFTANVQQSAL